MIATEADLLRTLEQGTYTLQDLYRMAETAGLADRPGGRDVIQDGKPQWKRRVRSALQGLKRVGRAAAVGGGSWIIEGTPRAPRRALFVWLPAEPGQLELVLGDVADVLRHADEPIDLIVADPPWALRRDRSDSAYRRTYRRDQTKVLAGYQDVDADEYAEFTVRWMAGAVDALRPSGCLAVVTGAQQAARVQVAGENAGLTYVNSIAVKRTMGLYCTRQFVHQHNTITLLTKGPLDTPARYFERPEDLPRGRNGEIYAIDWWADCPDERRDPGELRYDNAFSTKATRRIVLSCTQPQNLVADPFVGSGTTALVCLAENRRFYGGDINPETLRFTMARTLEAQRTPTLMQHLDRTGIA